MASMTGTFVASCIQAKSASTFGADGAALFEGFDTSTQAIRITKQGDEWTMTTVSITTKIKQITFKLGQEFDDTTVNNRPCKSTFTLDGDDKLVHVQKNRDGGLISTTVRKFTDAGMKITTSVGAEGASVTVDYKRQK